MKFRGVENTEVASGQLGMVAFSVILGIRGTFVPDRQQEKGIHSGGGS